MFAKRCEMWETRSAFGFCYFVLIAFLVIVWLHQVEKMIRMLGACENMLALNKKLLSRLEAQGMYGDVGACSS